MSNTLAPSRITARDPKGLKFMSIVEAAYNKAGLTSEDEAQRVNDTPGLADLIGNFIAENRLPDKYKNEKVKSSYGYLSGYRKPVAVADQIDILRSHWPSLNPDKAIAYARDVYPTFQLPGWIEGPFAWIRPGFFSNVYGEEVEEVLKALKKDRKGRFVNYRENQLGSDRLRQNVRTVTALQQIVERQPDSDIIIVPSQFGIRHRGRLVRQVREVFDAPEFGTGAKDGGTMMLTNPIRLQHYDDLWIDCAGDEYHDPQYSDAPFDRAPDFRFSDRELEFGTAWSGNARDYCGSASGFLVPQS